MYKATTTRGAPCTAQEFLVLLRSCIDDLAAAPGGDQNPDCGAIAGFYLESPECLFCPVPEGVAREPYRKGLSASRGDDTRSVADVVLGVGDPRI